MKGRRLVRELERRRVVVTTTDGETFDGILLDADDGHLVLVDAGQLAQTDEGVRSVSIDGQLWLPTERVAYLQRPEV